MNQLCQQLEELTNGLEELRSSIEQGRRLGE